jgi:hypothetical protein
VSILSPRELDRKIAECKLQADHVRDEYAWLYNGAWWADRRGAQIREDADPNAKAAGAGRQKGTGDPTGEVATARDKQAARRALKRALESVERGLGELRSAEYTLKHALESDHDPIPSTRGRALLTRAELAEARAAKERRMQRGEGHGDG